MNPFTINNGAIKRRFDSSSTDSETYGSSSSLNIDCKSARRKKIQRLSYTPPPEKDSRKYQEKKVDETISTSCNIGDAATRTSDGLEGTSIPAKHVPIWRQKVFKNSPVIVKSDPYAFGFTPPAGFSKIDGKQCLKPTFIQQSRGSKSTTNLLFNDKKVVTQDRIGESGETPKLKKVRKNVTSPHPAFKSRMSSSSTSSLIKDTNSNMLKKHTPNKLCTSPNLFEEGNKSSLSLASSSPRKLRKSHSENNLTIIPPLLPAPLTPKTTAGRSSTLVSSLGSTPGISRNKIISPHPGVRTSPRKTLDSTNTLIRSSSASRLPVHLPSKTDTILGVQDEDNICVTPVRCGRAVSPLFVPRGIRTSPRKKMERAFSTTMLNQSCTLLPARISPEEPANLDSQVSACLPVFAFGNSPIFPTLIEKAVDNLQQSTLIQDSQICPREILSNMSEFSDAIPKQNSMNAEDEGFVTPDQSFTSPSFVNEKLDVCSSLKGNVIVTNEDNEIATLPEVTRFDDGISPMKPILQLNRETSGSDYDSCSSSLENEVERKEVNTLITENTLKLEERCKLSYTKSCIRKTEIIPGSLLRNVAFNKLKVFYFDRQQGGDTVPHVGDVSIGMVESHFTSRLFSLISGKRPLITLTDSEDASDTEITDESRFAHCVGDYVSNLVLDRLDNKERIRMLKNCGVSVKKNSVEVSSIRSSRAICGCSCRGGVCIPTRCECALAGIQCQVDGLANDGTSNTHPCWCVADSCNNPEGRLEFERHKVREHFFTTMKRFTDMEKSGIYCSPTVTRFEEDVSDDEYVKNDQIKIDRTYFLKTPNTASVVTCEQNTSNTANSTESSIYNKELARVASCL